MINETKKINLFNEFYEWLKKDGLKPLRSERLHRKKIFSSLLNNEKMTMENFNDFLKDRILKEISDLKFNKINYCNKEIFIDDIIIYNSKEEFILKNKEFNMNLKCNFTQIKEIQKLVLID